MKTSGRTANYPNTVTENMISEAMEIGAIITGTHDWQGMREIAGESGLVALIQEYLDTDKLTRDSNFTAYEGEYDGNNQSKYWAGWEYND